LNTKQATWTSSINITTGTISSGSLTGRIGTTTAAPTIKASSSLLYETTNVATIIRELETTKLNKLTAGKNIIIVTDI
jgi:hypothetical protein